MATPCDSMYPVNCDRCSQLICSQYLPGVEGACYQYSSVIATILENSLPTTSLIYGLAKTSQYVLTNKSSDSWREYTAKIGSSFRSSLGRIASSAKRILCPAETCQGRIQSLAAQAIQWAANNPMKTLAIAAAGIIPPFIPKILQMPAITALVLSSFSICKKGDRWKQAATQKIQEFAEEFNRRPCRKMGQILTALGLASAFAGLVGGYIPEIIEKSEPYAIWLPFQTEGFVFVEYLIPTLIHGLFALQGGMNKKSGDCLFHALAALSTLAFPIYSDVSGQGVRLHHFWLGQIFQLFSFPSLKLFGLFLSIDGWIQIITPTGYEMYNGNTHQWTPSSYGCDNVIVDHLDSILFAGSLAFLIEGLAKIFFSQNNPRDLSVSQSIQSLIAKTSCRAASQEEEHSRLLKQPMAYSELEEPFTPCEV